MRFQSYFNTALKITNVYDGALPFHHFIKDFFKAEKKYGSTDRKIITQLCYSYFRLGKSLADISKEDKLRCAVFSCNEKSSDWFFLFDEDWQKEWNNNLNERISWLKKQYNFSVENIFSHNDFLSDEINVDDFNISHLIQPDVFLRVRPGYETQVVNILQKNNIAFKQIEKNCISIAASTKIDNVIELDKEAVVQDLSSQRIKEFLLMFKPQTVNSKPEISVWDCCAGSGGKSILAFDVLQNIQLTVSDVRASIIQNLKQRFNKSGIKNYKSFIADITNPKFAIPNSAFDVIICDAPCTGSGTWGRAPENLVFFSEDKIAEYAAKQKAIVSNAISSLKKNGFFLYITCSVFKQENENIVAFIQQQFNLNLIKKELLKGYDKKADTMFAVLFSK